MTKHKNLPLVATIPGLITAITVAGLIPSASVNAASLGSTYKVFDLGDLDPTGTSTRAVRINNKGQIAGRSHNGTTPAGNRANQAFIWENGTITGLPSTGLKKGGATDGQIITMPGRGGFVQAINDNGVVVGAADETDGPTDRAMYWTPSANGYTLEINDFGGVESYFLDINNSNQIAGRHIYGPGSLPNSPNRSRAITWQNDVLTYLSDLGGDTNTARGINNLGQLVGQIDGDGILNDTTVNTAALWEKDAQGNYVLTNLGNFGAEQSIARDINDKGQIIGWTINGSGSTATNHAFLVDNGNFVDIGGFGGLITQTADINQRGQVVGYSQNADGEDRAFLWQNGNIHDLNDLIGGLTYNGSTVTLSRATGINNKGQIVGYGSYTYLDALGVEQTGNRAFLVQAVPEPSTILATIVGGGLAIGARRKFRKKLSLLDLPRN
jgi:probable HAF family extracellular repeat protein